jgi:hypothetical protein
MNIHQLQLAFDAAEDRVLFRVSTTQQEEFRVYLTRRFVKMLWPHLVRALENTVVAKAPAPEARREVLAFEQDKALRETDFSQPFAEGQTEAPRRFPLGETPFVVTQGQLRLEAAGGYKLVLNPASGPGLEIGLNGRLLHSFSTLLEAAARKAEWDLPFLAQPQAPPEAPPQAPARHLLN